MFVSKNVLNPKYHRDSNNSNISIAPPIYDGCRRHKGHSHLSNVNTMNPIQCRPFLILFLCATCFSYFPFIFFFFFSCIFANSMYVTSTPSLGISFLLTLALQEHLFVLVSYFDFGSPENHTISLNT